VLRVHIGLDLEDETGDIVALRIDRRRFRGLRARAGRIVGNRLDQLLDPELLERRAEIDRRQITVLIGRQIKMAIAALCQLAFAGQPLERALAQHLGQFRIIQTGKLLRHPVILLAVAGRLVQLVALQVIDALELTAHAGRPAHRTDVQSQLVGDLVEQVERIAAFTVDLVDEGDDRHIAHPADLEQLQSL